MSKINERRTATKDKGKKDDKKRKEKERGYYSLVNVRYYGEVPNVLVGPRLQQLRMR